jgi:predicted MFS family arabinose efflux permease
MGLEQRYWGSFIFLGAVCLFLQLYSRYSSSSSADSATTGKFRMFQLNYLFVFLLAMFADWLQGPYVYELYVSYGFSQMQIAELFVCGFGSSMVVGTFVGGLADKLGRKNMCILYSLCYIVACCTKLVPEYWTLMVGRFLSGVSTSLLFSVFESWMVCEHHKQGFDVALLGETFSYATLGNGFVAVAAGLVANWAAADKHYVNPFMVAIAPLTVVAVVVFFTWGENYGNQQMSMLSSLSRGMDLVRRDSRIAALGMGQSCFEGAMYTFVFMWTPALKSDAETQAEAAGTEFPEATSTYLGLIFAAFMVAVMVGSSIFKVFATGRDQLYVIPLFMHATAFFAMAMVALFMDNKLVVYTMFLLFEMTVGVFYPSYGVIKSEKIPEDIRSAVMNIFRIPLNAFVVLLLLKIEQLPPHAVFSICTCAHGFAFLCYAYFYFNHASKSGDKSEQEMSLVSNHA